MGGRQSQMCIRDSIFSDDLYAEIELASWNQGPVFDWLAVTGKISADEMRRTFNCGVGFCAVVPAASADLSIEILQQQGEQAWRIGTVRSGASEVHYI